MVVLSTGAAFEATLGGTAAGDAFKGTNGADTIRGGGVGGILRGMSGDDRLYGAGGPSLALIAQLKYLEPSFG